MAIMPPRPVLSPDDAEEFVAQWLRFAGYRDAERTPRGADKGIDVRASGVVAQVKFFASKPVGRPALQQLHGAAAPAQRRALFFSSSGYTRPALEYAEAMGIALFTFAIDGEVTHVNRAAETIHRSARGLGPPISAGAAVLCRLASTTLAGVLGVLVWRSWWPSSTGRIDRDPLVGLPETLLFGNLTVLGVMVFAWLVGDLFIRLVQERIDARHGVGATRNEEGSLDEPPA